MTVVCCLATVFGSAYQSKKEMTGPGPLSTATVFRYLSCIMCNRKAESLPVLNLTWVSWSLKDIQVAIRKSQKFELHSQDEER